MAADLHLHSTASDGCLDPVSLLELANKHLLKTISLTDHDCLDNVDLAIKLSQKFDIEVIPGVELSSIWKGQDIHILGYFIDYKANWLKEILDEFRLARHQRAIEMVNLLRENGIDINFEEVTDLAGKGTIGRAHLARIMLKKGFIHSIQEAFNQFLGKNACCYVPKKVYGTIEVIELVKKAQGISVLAHPGINEIDNDIPLFIKKGLGGLEVYHPDHSTKKTRYYEQLAAELGLVITGGSDCHGFEAGCGLNIGTIYVDDKAVIKLKEEKLKLAG